MKSKIIQIKTFGRTGSNVITNYFSTVGYQLFNSHDVIEIEKFLTTGRPMIVHDHSYNYIIPKVGNTSLCILLKRRDVIAQMLSMLVAQHLNFYHETDENITTSDRPKPTDITPFELSKDIVLRDARTFNEWHYNAHITLANSGLPYFTLYYEDYINDLEYFNFLHHRDGFKILHRPEIKNSIQPKDIVANYTDVVEWLTEWNITNGVYNAK